MAGESAVWKASAVSIFAAFGDVVQSVFLRITTGTKVYDPATGTNVAPPVILESKLVWTQFGQAKYEKMFGPGGSIERYNFAYILPVEGFTPKVNDHIQHGLDYYTIDKIRADSAGIGAYWVVALIKVADAPA